MSSKSSYAYVSRLKNKIVRCAVDHRLIQVGLRHPVGHTELTDAFVRYRKALGLELEDRSQGQFEVHPECCGLMIVGVTFQHGMLEIGVSEIDPDGVGMVSGRDIVPFCPPDPEQVEQALQAAGLCSGRI